MGDFDFSRPVIAHHVEDMRLAHRAAGELGCTLVLQSAHGALYYAHANYLLSCFAQAQGAFPDVQSVFVIDAADAGAQALDAMRSGCLYLRSDAPPALRDKLLDLARQSGVEILAPARNHFDLATSLHPLSDCMEWLNAK